MSNLPYEGALLPPRPTVDQVRGLRSEYEAILTEVMAALADRYERAPGYPFIDAKLDLRTGADFPAGDPVRGRDTIYGWIQGRGLEALAGHAEWARGHAAATVQALAPRLTRMAREVLDALRRMRRRNRGHLYFFMKPDGTPFCLGPDGIARGLETDASLGANFSDLFAAKGMLAAARLLEDGEAEAEALEYTGLVDEAVLNGRFVTDQQPLDPKNPVRPVPGRFTHGHYMLQLASAALRARLKVDGAAELGLRLLRHELGRHANLGNRVPGFEEGDFWEAVDAAAAPYREPDGSVISDPGHALEFVGLAMEFARAARMMNLAPADRAFLDRAVASMPCILVRNFANGYQERAGGICKAFDLVTRCPLNTDMPWWSLPETMRAALLCGESAPDAEVRGRALAIFAACHNAFTQHYVRPDIHLMAVQTRAADGTVSDAIPATADADPGYHTGLSLLDVVRVLAARD